MFHPSTMKRSNISTCNKNELTTFLKYFLLVKLIILSLTLDTTATKIPDVHIASTTTGDTSGFSLRWEPMEIREKDPIVGIKILVWRTPCTNRTTYRYIGNQLMKIVESVHMTYSDTDLPHVLPEQAFSVKPDATTYTVPDIDRYVWYHVRLLPFTKTTEGPYTRPIQFKIGAYNDETKSCEKLISEVPVKAMEFEPSSDYYDDK